MEATGLGFLYHDAKESFNNAIITTEQVKGLSQYKRSHFIPDSKRFSKIMYGNEERKDDSSNKILESLYSSQQDTRNNMEYCNYKVTAFCIAISHFILFAILNCVLAITRKFPGNSRVPHTNSILLLLLFEAASSIGSMYFLYNIKILEAFTDMKETDAIISNEVFRNLVNFRVSMISCLIAMICYLIVSALFVYSMTLKRSVIYDPTIIYIILICAYLFAVDFTPNSDGWLDSVLIVADVFRIPTILFILVFHIRYLVVKIVMSYIKLAKWALGERSRVMNTPIGFSMSIFHAFKCNVIPTI